MTEERTKRRIPGQRHDCGNLAKVKQVVWSGNTAVRAFYCEACKVRYKREAIDLMNSLAVPLDNHPRQ